MSSRKRATNRAKTVSKAKTKTGVDGNGGVLDSNLGWATNFLAGGRFDIYVHPEGESADRNYPG